MRVRISDDGAVYVDDSGDFYVRVSRVLSGCGLSRTYYGSASHARDRGRAVHVACELINRSLLRDPKCDPAKALRADTVDPRLRPYIDAYLKFLREVLFVPVALEVSLGSIHGFAGTIDIVGLLNNELSIIDIKTGESIDPAVEYQTAAYEVLWHENDSTQLIKKRFALQLRGNATYKLHRMALPAESFLEKWDEFLPRVQ